MGNWQHSWLWLCTLLLLVGACTEPAAGISDAGISDDADTVETDGAFAIDAMVKPQLCESLTLPAQWNEGANCAIETDIEIYKLNSETYILRQSLCTSFEAPFLYLLFGEDKALLQDTGDGGIDIVGTVNTIVAQHEAMAGHPIELIVTNSHAHGDHTGANNAFAGDGATLVGTSREQIQNFFGMQWPRVFANYDLGGRVLQVAGIPGHESNHIAIFDTQLGILLTGDTLYPGRLYIRNFAEYKQSIAFLTTFAFATEVCAVLGTHIEMSETPGVDFPFGEATHPSEHPLALGTSELFELNQAVQDMADAPVREVHESFIITPL